MLSVEVSILGQLRPAARHGHAISYWHSVSNAKKIVWRDTNLLGGTKKSLSAAWVSCVDEGVVPMSEAAFGARRNVTRVSLT